MFGASIAPNCGPCDFLPVGSLLAQPMFICTTVTSGIKTLPELIERAKRQPGKLSFAATGIGRKAHLTGLLLQSRAGINLQVVPYTGGPVAALSDAIDGRVPLIIEAYSDLAGAIRAHTLNVLAVASTHRLPDFPQPADGRRETAGICRSGVAQAWWRRLGHQR